MYTLNAFHLIALLSFSFSLSPTQAYLPLVDRSTGTIYQRPLCPSRPATPEFQRYAFTEFINEIFFQENGIVNSFENFVSPDYIQHSPTILSGRDNTLNVLLQFGTSYAGINITILQLMFDAPYGMVHYKFQAPNSTALAFMDLWRFDGSCIMEHWDVVQSLDANATNPIALFR